MPHSAHHRKSHLAQVLSKTRVSLFLFLAASNISHGVGIIHGRLVGVHCVSGDFVWMKPGKEKIGRQRDREMERGWWGHARATYTQDIGGERRAPANHLLAFRLDSIRENFNIAPERNLDFSKNLENRDLKEASNLFPIRYSTTHRIALIYLSLIRYKLISTVF